MPLHTDKKLLTSLMVMGSVVEARDAYTGGHLWRVAQFSRLLASELGMSRREIFLAGLGGFVHDLGKVGVPDSILNKPGPLSDEEYGIIKTHPAVGQAILSDHPLSDLVEEAVAAHHERPDGRGYPRRLEGDAIPLIARIVGIADAFDAMTSTRPYRRGMDVDRATAILSQERGRQFDVAMTDAFLAIASGDAVLHVVGHSFVGARMAECPKCGPIIPTHDIDDGHVHGCHSCHGQLRLHRHGDLWQAEVMKGPSPPEMLAPQPDFAPIRQFVAEAPY